MNIQEARNYFYNLHDIECNQKYDSTLPYSFHLKCVEEQAIKFQHLIPNRLEKARPLNIESHTIGFEVMIAILAHDSIEDARITYNDLNKVFGDIVAEIVYLCTDNKGRNRDERKNEQFYNELKTNKLAIFVKLCDLISNVKFSFLTNSSMLYKYKCEYYEKVKPNLYTEEYTPMFEYLEKIFSI